MLSLPLIMVLVLAVDLFMPSPPWPLTRSAALCFWLVPPMLLSAAAACSARLTRKQLIATPATAPIQQHTRHLALLCGLAPLCLAVSVLTGLSEVLAGLSVPGFLATPLMLSPWILAGLLSLMARQPLYATLQQTLVLRRLDRGDPLPPVHRPFAHAAQQARTVAVVSAAPAFFLLVFCQAVHAWVPPAWSAAALLIGIMALHTVAPQLIARLLPTQRLQDGPTRSLIARAIKKPYPVPPDLRIWHTGQSVVNAAALASGIPGRRRGVILFTDALLDRIPDTDLGFVAGHEAGHLYHRHHKLATLTALALAGGGYATLKALLPPEAWRDPLTWAQAALGIGLFTATGMILILRNIEQHADAYATGLLSDGDRITPTAIQQAQQALNNLHRFSRGTDLIHGALPTRLDAVSQLEGLPVNGTPIDRRIRWIRRGVGIACVAVALSFVR